MISGLLGQREIYFDLNHWEKIGVGTNTPNDDTVDSRKIIQFNCMQTLLSGTKIRLEGCHILRESNDK